MKATVLQLVGLVCAPVGALVQWGWGAAIVAVAADAVYVGLAMEKR
jgi:hypothetical protein